MAGVVTTQSEIRLANLLEQREITTQKWEGIMAEINGREDQTPTEVEAEHIKLCRETVEEIDAEAATLAGDIEKTGEAMKEAARMRRIMAGVDSGGMEETDDGQVVYRTFSQYARDEILTRGGQLAECAKIAQAAGGEDAVLRARERLQQLKSRV